MTPFFDSIFTFERKDSDLGVIALDGAKALGDRIDRYLVDWYNAEVGRCGSAPTRKTFLIGNACPRFTTGDGKGIVEESVRGKDLYLICDPGNYSLKYKIFDRENCMSPDDHYADLKRIISAVAGKASRLTVIMPSLYGGRQHRRNSRESLDCSQMLHELEHMGVSGLITFDAHDPRVQNAVPLMGFDNFFPTYQVMKALLRRFPGIKLGKDDFMVVSPDEGAMGRNIYYASMLGVELGMFYKRRDYSTVVNGRNAIVAHEYIGNSVEGKSVFVADDIIATGDSILHLSGELKAKGAKNIFLSATYALFTEGVERFDRAYADGLFTALLSTNLTYLRPELKGREWFVEADMSKFIAYIVAACNQNRSLSGLLDPHDKIGELIDNFGKKD